MRQNFKLVMALFLGATLISCDDENIIKKPNQEPVQPTILQFTATQHSLSENDESKTFILSLSKAAEIDANVTIQVNNANQNTLITTPDIENEKIELLITKGSNQAAFTITTINNPILDGSKTITFSIHSVSEGFSIGINKELVTTITDDEGPVQINFSNNQSTVDEDFTEGQPISFAFSQAATGNGTIEVSLNQSTLVYGQHFTTVPQAANGKIILPVNQGDESALLRVLPLNNATISGERTLTLEITHTTGALVKGDLVNHTITINDDDLKGFSKSYSIGGGGWGAKRYFGYREDGQLSKVYWEQTTPSFTSGYYHYHYNASARLTKMNESDFIETQYSWEGDRIVKAEKFNDGTLTQYTLYAYDEAGNVGEAAVHYRQPSGELKLGLLFVYLYYWDGNLYKQLTYAPVEGSEDYSLISTRTYENYLANENPFPIEIIPNINAQPNLPGSYRVEENGHDFTYQFFYEFGPNGKLVKRTASSAAGTEVATYQYY